VPLSPGTSAISAARSVSSVILSASSLTRSAAGLGSASAAVRNACFSGTPEDSITPNSSRNSAAASLGRLWASACIPAVSCPDPTVTPLARAIPIINSCCCIRSNNSISRPSSSAQRWAVTSSTPPTSPARTMLMATSLNQSGWPFIASDSVLPSIIWSCASRITSAKSLSPASSPTISSERARFTPEPNSAASLRASPARANNLPKCSLVVMVITSASIVLE